MKIHLLSGDALVERFEKTGIEGEVLVCRECLVDGDLRADNLEDFWNVRNSYLSNSYIKPDNFYQEKVKGEFCQLIDNAEAGNEINLWFEYEVFCQVNLWFSLWLLRDDKAEIYIVYPLIDDEKDIWKGFGYLDVDDLKKSFEQRVKLTKEDIELGSSLWKAFQEKDFDKLKELSKYKSKGFPTLTEVTEAIVDIETRPKETLRKIITDGTTEFGKVFQEFNRIESIYGFGDLQVKTIFDELQT